MAYKTLLYKQAVCILLLFGYYSIHDVSNITYYRFADIARQTLTQQDL